MRLIRIWETTEKVARSLLVLVLAILAFVLMASGSVPHGGILMLVAFAVIIWGCWQATFGVDDSWMRLGAFVTTIALGLFGGGLHSRAMERGDAFVVSVFLVVTILLVSASAYAYVREVWEWQSVQERFERLPYVIWRKAFRRVAIESDDEEERIEALLRLRMPDDEDVLRAALKTCDEYAGYDPAEGWPHRHVFGPEGEEVVRKRVECDDASEAWLVSMTRRCSCGVARIRTTRRRLVVLGEGVCPRCGGHVSLGEEQVWMGGHFTFMEIYACDSCGWSSDTDFSSTYEEWKEEHVSTTYEW